MRADTRTAAIAAAAGAVAWVATARWAPHAGVFPALSAAGCAALALQAPRRSASALPAGPGLPGARRPRSAGRVASTLAATSSAGRLTPLLERAGSTRGAGAELAGLAAAAGAVWAVVVVLAGAPWGLTGLAAVVLVWWGRLRLRAASRLRHFEEQLPDCLQMLSSSLRAGHGLLASLAAVAAESREPAAGELGRAVGECQLGLDVVDALSGVAARTGSEDFAWVVDAIAVQRELGGELAVLVDNVAGTVRERQRVRRQVRALSAEGRLSAVVLLVIPVALVVVLQVLNPQYLAVLTENAAGMTLLVGAAVLMVVGALWLRRITQVKF